MEEAACAKRVEPLGKCPLVDWYEFVHCTVQTCKNYTEETARKCIAIDRVRPEGTKVISDAEIHMYKFNGLGVSGRLIQMKRKKAIDRVKCMLILYKFITYVRLNKKEGGVFNTPTMIELENEYPLNRAKLGWRNWMWDYILDEETWKEFLQKADGDCKEYTLRQILSCKTSKFEKLISEFNNPA